MAEQGSRTRRPAKAKAAPIDVVDESGPELPQLPVEPVTTQFPALSRTEAGLTAEVAQRSVDGSDGDLFHKVFSIGRLGVESTDPLHRANAVMVVQEAMQRGLHPRGDVHLLEAVEHDEPLNALGTRRSQYTDLRYAVQVVPSSVDTSPQDTTTPTDIHNAE